MPQTPTEAAALALAKTATAAMFVVAEENVALLRQLEARTTRAAAAPPTIRVPAAKPNAKAAAAANGHAMPAAAAAGANGHAVPAVAAADAAPGSPPVSAAATPAARKRGRKPKVRVAKPSTECRVERTHTPTATPANNGATAQA